MTTPTMAKYVSKHMYSVNGYLRSWDATLMRVLLRLQESRSVGGNLCEIGVHHGRLFLLLALARRHGETAIAIDLFEDDEINRNSVQAKRRGALQRNASRLNISLTDNEIWKQSSLDLSADLLLTRAGGPVRFFSIDGGHMYQHVASDLQLARHCVVPEGIIAVDDFFCAIWPEVSAATVDFIRNNPALAPVFITPNKLYLAHRDWVQTLLDNVLPSLPRSLRVQRFPVSWFGSAVASITPTYAERVAEKVRHSIWRRPLSNAGDVTHTRYNT